MADKKGRKQRRLDKGKAQMGERKRPNCTRVGR